MAIELRKTGYCKDCPYFEPESFSAEITSNDTGYSVIQTDIKCKHEEACKRMNGIITNIHANLKRTTYCSFTMDDPTRNQVLHIVDKAFESVEGD